MIDVVLLRRESNLFLINGISQAAWINGRRKRFSPYNTVFPGHMERAKMKSGCCSLFNCPSTYFHFIILNLLHIYIFSGLNEIFFDCYMDEINKMEREDEPQIPGYLTRPISIRPRLFPPTKNQSK